MDHGRGLAVKLRPGEVQVRSGPGLVQVWFSLQPKFFWAWLWSRTTCYPSFKKEFCLMTNHQWLVKWRHLERLFLKQEFIVVANNKVVWLSEPLSLTIDPGQPLQSVKIPELKAFILFSFAEKIFIASMDPNLEQQHKLEHILSRWHIFWWRVNKQFNLTQFD